MVVVSAATDVMKAAADANAAADTPENPAIAAAGRARLAIFDENGHRYTARRALWSLENRKNIIMSIILVISYVLWNFRA